MSEDVKNTDLAAAEELNDQMQHRRDKLAQYEDKGGYGRSIDDYAVSW